MTLRELLEAIEESENFFRPYSHFGHGIDTQHIYLETMSMTADKNTFTCKWASVPDFAIAPPDLGILSSHCKLEVTVSDEVVAPTMLVQSFAAPYAKLVSVSMRSSHIQKMSLKHCQNIADEIAFQRGSITFRPGFDRHTRQSDDHTVTSMMAGMGKKQTMMSKKREFIKLNLLKQAVFTYDKPLQEGRSCMTNAELIEAITLAEQHFRPYTSWLDGIDTTHVYVDGFDFDSSKNFVTVRWAP